MRKRILKHTLRAHGVTMIDAAAWTDLLSVAFEDEELCVWVASPAERPSRRWTFWVLETGEYAPEGMEHIGTAHGQLRGQPYVAHVYAKQEVLP